VFIVELIFTVT